VSHTIVATKPVLTKSRHLLGPHEILDQLDGHPILRVKMISDTKYLVYAPREAQHAGQRVELVLALEHPIALVGEVFVPAVTSRPGVECVGVSVEYYELGLRFRHLCQQPPDLGEPRVEERLHLPRRVTQPHCRDVTRDDERRPVDGLHQRSREETVDDCRTTLETRCRNASPQVREDVVDRNGRHVGGRRERGSLLAHGSRTDGRAN
jgi:hypothetical protein